MFVWMTCLTNYSMQAEEYKSREDQDSLANDNSLEDRDKSQQKKIVYERYLHSKGVYSIVVAQI